MRSSPPAHRRDGRQPGTRGAHERARRIPAGPSAAERPSTRPTPVRPLLAATPARAPSVPARHLRSPSGQLPAFTIGSSSAATGAAAGAAPGLVAVHAAAAIVPADDPSTPQQALRTAFSRSSRAAGSYPTAVGGAPCGWPPRPDQPRPLRRGAARRRVRVRHPAPGCAATTRSACSARAASVRRRSRPVSARSSPRLRQDDRVVAIDADTAFGKLGSRIDPNAAGSYWELAADEHLDTFADVRSRGRQQQRGPVRARRRIQHRTATGARSGHLPRGHRPAGPPLHHLDRGLRLDDGLLDRPGGAARSRRADRGVLAVGGRRLRGGQTMEWLANRGYTACCIAPSWCSTTPTATPTSAPGRSWCSSSPVAVRSSSRCRSTRTCVPAA